MSINKPQEQLALEKARLQDAERNKSQSVAASPHPAKSSHPHPAIPEQAHKALRSAQKLGTINCSDCSIHIDHNGNPEIHQGIDSHKPSTPVPQKDSLRHPPL